MLLAQDVPGVTLRAVLQPVHRSARRAQPNRGSQPQAGVRAGQRSTTAPSIRPARSKGWAWWISTASPSLGEKTEFTYYHSFPNSQNFGQLAEEFFIGGSGLKLRLYAGEGNAIPSGGGPSGLAEENYRGFTDVFGGVLSYPVIRSRQQTLNLFVDLDALESNVRTGPASYDLNTTSFNSLRVLRVGEDYALSDLWLGTDRPALNALTVRLSQGLPILGAETDGTAPDAARQGEQSNFFKINFQATRTQTLFSPTPVSSVALMGLLTGQWSQDILPPAEQFYLGGSQFTRGYYSGQIPGDKALAATAELQFNTGTNLSMWGLSANVSTQLYLFYDWGETWQNRVHRLRHDGQLGRCRRAHAGDPIHRSGFRGGGPVQSLSYRKRR